MGRPIVTWSKEGAFHPGSATGGTGKRRGGPQTVTLRKHPGPLLLLLPAVLMTMAASCRPKSAEIRVITDRTESNLAPLFAAYEESTGNTVKAVYVDQGLVSRLESRPEEADIVITKDADLLEFAKKKGLLQPFSSFAIEKAVPARYRDPDGMYFSDSYRARVIYYSRDRVKPGELSTYEALGLEKWKGRVCIRSGYHDYNLNLFSQMLVTMGAGRTRAFLESLAANLAITPGGSDRDQVKAVYEKKCDVAIANSYYMGIMLSSPDQRPWGLSARVFFPDQDAGGTFILRSGLALTTARAHVKAARALLEYMVQDDTQDYMAKLTFAYPVNGRQPMPEINRKLGQGQAGVKNGVFKIHEVPLAAVAGSRKAVIQMLDEILFDKPR
jgi:iron(III) transport system substrate-binding protein